MSLIDELSGQPGPCDASDQCRNAGDLCSSCKFATRFHGISNNWVSLIPGRKHPNVVAAKESATKARHAAKLEQRRTKDRSKVRVLQQARQAERQTERNYIKATKNSGRSNRDGDHATPVVTLDTKNQTGRTNPVVSISELLKVQQDARRAGNPIGALVVRNQYGIGVVALFEEDFARLMHSRGVNQVEKL